MLSLCSSVNSVAKTDFMSNKTKSQRKTQLAKKSAVPAPIAASILDTLLPIIGGAIVTMFALSLLKFGAAEVWSPFARGGAQIFRALAVSALAGGIATAVLGRRFAGPLAATACSLGWALWGLALHRGAQGRYLQILGGGFSVGQPESLLFANAVSQSLCVAFALLIASAVSWFWARRRADSMFDEAPVTDDDLEGNGLKSFGTAFVYPLSTAIGGAALLIVFGLLALPLGEPPISQLPSGVGAALWCGLLTMAALLVATFAARRAFRALGSAGDIIVAPLVIALVAMLFLASSGQSALLRPAALLIWHASAFELSSWGALGASLGYYFARATMK